MNSHLYHVQINIDHSNVDFYKNLLKFMGWEVIFEKPNSVIGFKSHTSGDLWFVQADHLETTDYDAKGMNHISLRVDIQEDINALKDFLESKGTKMLFDTPKHRPEFSDNKNETYYQIMFESPDKILWEVVYIGKK